jgi:glycyl-tRNA synthetase beta chain
MAELLLEIFSEEMPAIMQNQAVINLSNLFDEQAKKSGISYKQVNCYVAPRRLVLVVDTIEKIKANEAIEKKGPRTDAPAESIVGFLRTNNISKKDLYIKEIKGQQFYFANIIFAIQNIQESIIQVINYILHNFPWPKTMRWDETNVKWVRPIRNILCILDGAILPINFGKLTANNVSSGHRFMSGYNFAVKDFADYTTHLAANNVILDHKERRGMVLFEANKLADDLNLRLLMDDSLIDEIVGLVEYPICLLGKIDNEFLEVPKEVLIATMKTHQKYFALLSKNNSFAPFFIMVSNIVGKDPQQIISGNEKVLRARLYDAKFFYDQDKKNRLDSRVNDLKKVVFHDELGSLFDKTNRVINLSKEIAKILNLDINIIEQSARLSKADLTSNLVKEFPELQGIIGQYYALNDGEDMRVANAISEHYLPAGKSDCCPKFIEGAIVSIADKLDSIVGLFFIDEAPTSSKDPYGLRRSALGIIRIMIEHKLDLDLHDLVEYALKSYEGSNKITDLIQKVIFFFHERFKFLLKDKFRYDLINAVTSNDNIYSSYQKIVALKDFYNSENGKEVLTILRRIANFIPPAYAKSDLKVDQKLFSDDLEKKLYEVIDQASKELKKVDLVNQFSMLNMLVKPVNDFCDKVTVMDDDENIKINRINLLRNIQTSVSELGIDFSVIEL